MTRPYSEQRFESALVCLQLENRRQEVLAYYARRAPPPAPSIPVQAEAASLASAMSDGAELRGWYATLAPDVDCGTPPPLQRVYPPTPPESEQQAVSLSPVWDEQPVEGGEESTHRKKQSMPAPARDWMLRHPVPIRLSSTGAARANPAFLSVSRRHLTPRGILRSSRRRKQWKRARCLRPAGSVLLRAPPHAFLMLITHCRPVWTA